MSELRTYSAIDTRVSITGRPLKEIGLHGASIVHPDGHETPLTGLIFPFLGRSTPELVRKALEEQYPGCKLVIPL